ncbi:SusC/RagA family TonB-linked outer membrane protein [Lutibacter flavus]|uniref:TonB-linked outer membrane protein, SusC/RagA family n=1 Tax=Lutibacter flavus TaxID=691689 RepID=A0A238Y292_9FLAO|nr:SusC/RagA family TonB-linked outer membrane protein [Lutibacter flavus]SNR64429.1 TonB-linked outer membrane protein, SusC/RagA family [Lutibacter flavus]
MRTKFNGLLTLLLALIVQFSFAQEKTVTGSVSDASGPLPGVTVVVKGTNTGTQTDFDGNYSITAAVGAVLKYSYIGMQPSERKVGASNVINVTMQESAEALEEVVVTGFGRKVEKRSATFAVQQVGGEEMSQARESNIVNSLSGKIAGVQITNSSGAVGSSSRVVLRGASSLTGSNQPLYVVNGVPLESGNFGNAGSGGGADLPNGVSDINPDDIESISVLKGPAAAALYGVRAANGVIQIKTKTGRASSALGISVNSTVSFETPLMLPNYQNSYGQGGNHDYFEWIDGTSGDGGVDESWGPPLDVGLEFVQWNSYTVDGAPLPWVSQPDNIKNFYDTGLTLNNNVSFTGGAENIGYRLSVASMDQTGMVPNTDLRRFSVGGSSTYTMSDKLTSSVDFNYTRSKSDNFVTQGYNNENPVQQMIWAGRNVDFELLRDWENLPLSPAGTAAAGTPINWNTVFQNNPYWVLDTNTREYNRDRIVGNIALNYAFNDSFSISGKVGTNFWNSRQNRRQAFGSNNAPNGSYSETSRTYTETNSELIASYNTKITEDLAFELSAGGNSMYRKSELAQTIAPQLQLPGLYNVSNLAAGSSWVVNNSFSEQKINSLFGFGKFSYKNYLFLEFSGRNDWSSLLPVSDNSFFYPSVTASAVVTDMIDVNSDVLSFLKVRGGWSQVGGIGALNPYSLQPTYSLSTETWGGNSVAFLPSQLNNPNIKSETTSGTEFGIDVRLLNSKVRFNATYYDQTSKDLVVPVQVTAASGYTSAVQNVGELNNKGIELQLGATVVQKGDFQFDVDVNFAKNTNKVVSLGGLESLVLGGQWSMTLEAREGQPYGSIVGTYFDRSPSGDVIYENGLPKIAAGTKELGNITPDWTGGANFTFKYKNFSLNALIDAKIGGDIHTMTYTWGRYAGILAETALGRETGIVGDGVMLVDGNYVPNTVTVPAENYNKRAYSNSVVESAVFDASYVKLRQVMLTYKLPKNLIGNTLFTDINFSLVGRNLAILHKNTPHIDPESSFSDSNANQGQEFGQLPSARSVGFNIQLKL